jgi:ribose/xylose/arabinose/galactoside ABC-type transport system permease subunit
MTFRFQRELSVAAAYSALLLLLYCRAPSFFRGNQFLSTLVASAPVLVAAIGMTLVILARHIDISVGSQWSVCGVVAGLLARSGWPMPAVAVTVMLLGGLLGGVNGALIATVGLPSIVVTLATMVILREGLRWAREGEFVRGLPADFQWFGFGQDRGQWLIMASAAAVFMAFAWGLRNIAAGRNIYATGSDPEAAFLVGIRPQRVTFGVFVVAGALIGLAALLHSVRFASVDPTAGTGKELAVIAAVVVGGVAISGGRGTLVGPLFGVLLLGSIGSALVFFGAEAHWEKAIQGLIILIAVAGDAWRPRGN